MPGAANLWPALSDFDPWCFMSPDLLLRLAVFVCMALCNAIVFLRGYGATNPVAILSVTFFLPMAIATLRLSGLQHPSWTQDTYLLLYEAVAVWLVLPTLVLSLAPHVRRSKTSRRFLTRRLQKFYGAALVAVARGFAFCIVAAYVASNLVQAGTPLPLVEPDIIQSLHSNWLPGLRSIVVQVPLGAVLMLLAFSVSRSPADFILLLVVVALPLSRGGRIATFEAIVALTVIQYSIPVVRMSRKWLPAVLLAAVLAAGLLTSFGTQRMNRFGRYDVRYQTVIQWHGPIDRFDILPALYAYFPLSFENLDRFVRASPASPLPGTASLAWLFVGITKLNAVFPVLDAPSYTSLYTPVSTGATVTTALSAFFLDFGPYLAFIPMLVTMLAWLYVYWQAARSVQMAIFNAVVASAFALAAFQPVIVSGAFGQVAMAALLAPPLARSVGAIVSRKRATSSEGSDTRET